jgi:hypothetical protein
MSGLAALAMACTSSESETVSARVELINVASSALTAGSITSLNGTYGSGCAGKSSGSFTVAVGAGVADANQLTVAKNDIDCVLTITSVVVGATTYAAGPSLVLATGFAPAASAFKDVALDPVDFYGNAKISSYAYASDFVISLVVSDNNQTATGGQTGTFSQWSASVVASNIPAPNYTVDFSNMSFTTDSDTIVEAALGYAQLIAGSVVGQTWATSSDVTLDGNSTQETLAAAYASPMHSGSLASLTTLRIPASQFDMETEATPLVRKIIIRNTDGDSGATGITSYEVITVTFGPAAQ